MPSLSFLSLSLSLSHTHTSLGFLNCKERGFTPCSRLISNAIAAVFSKSRNRANHDHHSGGTMAGFDEQVKERAKELKQLVKKGMKAVGETCKKTWHKVRHIRG